MKDIKYVDLGQHWSEEREELLPIIEEIMSTGMFVGGDIIEIFESKVAKYLGTTHCVALNSGTDALVCAMLANGIGPGSEVITPPNSFVASTATIVHIRAKPVFADVLPDQSMDPDKVRAAVTSKTRAIMPVHLTGRMAKMDEINAIADEYGLLVVEDAAQSIGSKYKSKKSGNFSDVGCFSAHPLKNLNACGDSGFVVTNNNEVADNIKTMRNHGLVDRDTVEKFGFVSRMDVLQAAILNYRIDRLDEVIEKRRYNASIYKNHLNRDQIFFPEETAEYFDTFHTFVIQVDHRDELMKNLESKGIQTAIHYPIPIHLQPAAKDLGYSLGDFPSTETQSQKILTLPINQFLSEDEIIYIASQVNEFFD